MTIFVITKSSTLLQATNHRLNSALIRIGAKPTDSEEATWKWETPLELSPKQVEHYLERYSAKGEGFKVREQRQQH